jgi:hypothetical protein
MPSEGRGGIENQFSAKGGGWEKRRPTMGSENDSLTVTDDESRSTFERIVETFHSIIEKKLSIQTPDDLNSPNSILCEPRHFT